MEPARREHVPAPPGDRDDTRQEKTVRTGVTDSHRGAEISQRSTVGTQILERFA